MYYVSYVQERCVCVRPRLRPRGEAGVVSWASAVRGEMNEAAGCGFPLHPLHARRPGKLRAIKTRQQATTQPIPKDVCATQPGTRRGLLASCVDACPMVGPVTGGGAVRGRGGDER